MIWKFPRIDWETVCKKKSASIAILIVNQRYISGEEPMRGMNVIDCLTGCVLSAVFSACHNASTTGGKTKVAFVSNNAAEFWTIAEAGTRKAEKELEIEVLFKRPPTG